MAVSDRARGEHGISRSVLQGRWVPGSSGGQSTEHLELFVEQRVAHRVERLGAARRPGEAKRRAVLSSLRRRRGLRSRRRGWRPGLCGRRPRLPAARDDAPRPLVRRAVLEEVDDEDVIELETLGLEDGQLERRGELRRQPLLGRLVAHEHRLVCAELNLAVGRVRAHEHHGQVVGGRVAEEHRLGTIEVAAVLLERVDLMMVGCGGGGGARA